MVGRTHGHYFILQPLGLGGMGEVYLAEVPLKEARNLLDELRSG